MYMYAMLREMRNWAKAGLISEIKGSDLPEDKISEMFAVIRKHITDEPAREA